MAIETAKYIKVDAVNNNNKFWNIPTTLTQTSLS